MTALGPISLCLRRTFSAGRLPVVVTGFLGSLSTAARCPAAVIFNQLSPTVYQTEHCLFVIDGSVTWSSPTTAYAEIYGAGASPPYFPRLSGYYDILTAAFPANYFSICYIANTRAPQVPNYIDRQYKGTGISQGIGSAGLGTSAVPGTPQSFASVDLCRYSLPGGNVVAPVLGVFDHEIGHAWGAQLFYFLNQPSLCNGHWLPNSTVDCQMGAGATTDGYVTVNKIKGDPVQGFTWQRVSNARSNDQKVFSEQALYLMGVSPRFPTSYVLNQVAYQIDGTVTATSVDTFDHTATVATYGVRNPDYQSAPKQFRLGFVYVARDLDEVNAVFAVVENSIDDFCSGEQLSTTTYRGQTPFLADTRYRASADGLLAELDGTRAPLLSAANPYVNSTDGSAVVNFAASDPDGPSPAVALVPAASTSQVVGSQVLLAGLPDGVHFFTVKATDAGNRKTFAHFVVEVHRPATGVVVTTGPSDVVGTAGSPATFLVAAAGGGVLSYRWWLQRARSSTWNALVDDATYAGVQTPTLTVGLQSAMDGDTFLCVVSDGSGTVTSGAARVTVNEQPAVLKAQPQPRSVTPGSSTYFNVTAGDAARTFGYFTYQWQRRTAAAGTWQDIVEDAAYVGTSQSQLTLYGATLAMDGDELRCVVGNTAGFTTSVSAALAVGMAPVIVTQPQPITTSVGQSVALSVSAAGSGTLLYEWYDYATLVGTGPTLTLNNIQAADAGTYGVHISSPFGVAYSNNVSVNVATGAVAPLVTFPLASAALTAGQSFTWTVVHSGTAPFTYQWRRNKIALAGATSDSFTLTGVMVVDAGDYDVVVSNTVGSALTNVATVTVALAAATLTLTDLAAVYDGTPHAPSVTTAPSDSL